MAVYLVPPLNPSTWIFHPSTFYPQPLSAPSPDTSLAAPGSPRPWGAGCWALWCAWEGLGLPPSQMNHAPRHVVN